MKRPHHSQQLRQPPRRRWQLRFGRPSVHRQLTWLVPLHIIPHNQGCNGLGRLQLSPAIHSQLETKNQSNRRLIGIHRPKLIGIFLTMLTRSKKARQKRN